MSELCQRCGNMGSDRRTLWHACFYAMNELKIPFVEEVLFHAELKDLEKASDPVTIDIPGGPEITIQPGTVKSNGKLTPMKLFTLRVCKRCRGEWMQAVEQWFLEKPASPDLDADESQPSEINSGIFVRHNGATVEISREEWEKRTQGSAS